MPHTDLNSCCIALRREVQFAETDMAGIVHFSSMLMWVEAAENAFFRHLNLPLFEQAPDGSGFGWPRTRFSCNFRSPIFFRDAIQVDLLVYARVGPRIDYRFRIFRLASGMHPEWNGGPCPEGFPKLAAAGEMATCCASMTRPPVASQAEPLLQPMQPPETVVSRLKEAPHAILELREPLPDRVVYCQPFVSFGKASSAAR